jgi:hypothetical protein
LLRRKLAEKFSFVNTPAIGTSKKICRNASNPGAKWRRKKKLFRGFIAAGKRAFPLLPAVVKRQ